MKFLHLYKSPSYVICQAKERTLDLETRAVIPRKPVGEVRFNEFAGKRGIPTTSLPYNSDESDYATCWSMVDSAEAAQGIRDAGHIFMEDGVDVTERRVIEHLLASADYGVRMIAVDEEGNELGIDDEARSVFNYGDGAYCSPCGKHIKSRAGVPSHVESASHQRNLRMPRRIRAA